MKRHRIPPFFYRESCHPPLLTRRQLLAGGGALVAVGALHPGIARGGDDGTAIIRRYATLPDDPWAVCHGVRAMGRDFTMKGGRRAVDWLLETQLALIPANGTSVLAFPIAVEVHPNMFLKTLLEAGVPLDHAFTHHGRRRTLQDVVEGSRALFHPSEVAGQANLLPWSLNAFARTMSPLRGRWTNAWGELVDLDAVVEAALRLLERASLPVMQAMRERRPEAVKAPVHDFTCGGTHMIYGLSTAVLAGYVGRDRLERMRQQVALLVWRLGADLEMIDRFYKERAHLPGAYWFALDAKLKFLGHGEECLALAVRRGLVTLTAGQQEQRRTAAATLRQMLGEVETHDLAEARRLDQDLFRQLVGDACHARHGLTLV